MNDKKAQTRERILQAACQALIQRGPVEPSVGEIMASAGLTVGGFYAHFESKDALMLEAFRALLAVRREQVALLEPGVGGLQRREKIAAFYLSPQHRDAEGPKACPLPTSVAYMDSLPEAFREVLAEHVRVMAAQLACDPQQIDLALADIALMLGGVALARALGPGALSDQVLSASRAAVL